MLIRSRFATARTIRLARHARQEELNAQLHQYVDDTTLLGTRVAAHLRYENDSIQKGAK